MLKSHEAFSNFRVPAYMNGSQEPKGAARTFRSEDTLIASGATPLASRPSNNLIDIRAAVWAHVAMLRSLCCPKRNTWICGALLRVNRHLLATSARKDRRNPIDEYT